MRLPYSIFITLLSFCILPATAWPAKSEGLPVCIVGAGPTGLTAASRLEAKGYEALIFEREEKIGGKCQSYYDEAGIFHPMGAAFFSNASYAETVKVINASGVLSEPFALAGAREQFRFNIQTGASEQLPPLSAQFVQALVAEIPRYAALWQKVFAPISVPGYTKGIPEELTVSADEWFAKNNFTALPILLVDPLALYGYGDIRIVPILYILQYITPDILTGFTGQHSVYYIDFYKVWVQWAKRTLKAKIHTKIEISCIDRNGPHPVITYTEHGAHKETKTERQKCSHVVLAFPPTIDNLERTGIKLTSSEDQVFRPVGVHNYFSSAVNFNLPFGVSYIANSSSPTVPPPNNGEPVAVLRLSPNSSISTSWSWGPYREFQSERQAYDLLLKTLSKINKDPRNATAPAEPLRPEDVREFRKWDYFPHFDSKELKGGWYEKLRCVQGSRKTYFASGLDGMETVEWAIRAGQNVVDSHF